MPFICERLRVLLKGVGFLRVDLCIHYTAGDVCVMLYVKIKQLALETVPVIFCSINQLLAEDNNMVKKRKHTSPM